MKTKIDFRSLLIGGMMALMTLVIFNSCTKCSGEQPRARILNKGTKTADVQIKTSGGNIVNINGVAPGTTSAFSSFAPGSTTLTITVDKVNYVRIYPMAECFEYDIAIDANNNITSNASDRNN